MSKNDGGPAFPRPRVPNYNDAQQGMTLRDWFASQALIAIYAGIRGANASPRGMAEAAYIVADAMLSERSK